MYIFPTQYCPSYTNFTTIKNNVKTRISDLAFKIFECLADYFLKTLDFIWPLPNPNKMKKVKMKTTFGQIGKRVLKDLEKKNEIREERAVIAAIKENSSYSLQIPTTGFFLGVNYGLVPFTVFNSTKDPHFIASAVTAANIKTFLSWYCNGKLNLSFLEKYGLFNHKKEEDEIGRLLYGTTLLITFKKINDISPLLSPYLNTASTLIQVPFLQNFFLNLPIISHLNQNLHLNLQHVKFKTKNQIAYSLTKVFLYVSEKFFLPKIDILLNKKKQNKPQNLFITYMQSILQEEIEEKASTSLTMISDKISNNLAERIITTTIGITKSLIYLHFLNKMLTSSVIRNPLMRASQLILAGGITQEPFDLSLRVTGACAFLSTGSSKIGLTIIYLPKLVMKFLRMRKHQLKKYKRDDPFHTLFPTIFQTKELTAPLTELKQMEHSPASETFETLNSHSKENNMPYASHLMAAAAGFSLILPPYARQRIGLMPSKSCNPLKDYSPPLSDQLSLEDVYNKIDTETTFQKVWDKKTIASKKGAADEDLLALFLSKNGAKL